ncbi:MAG TPA: STAS domain-containing protein [Gemmata sp.]
MAPEHASAPAASHRLSTAEAAGLGRAPVPDPTAPGGCEPLLVTLTEPTGADELSALVDTLRAAVGAGRGVTVDCSAVTFLGTGVAQVLLALERACRSRARPYALIGVPESADGLLRLAGLETVFGR